jgi:hypothetical protein
MNKKIKVTYSSAMVTKFVKGKSIPKGTYDLISNADNTPSFEFRWMGGSWNNPKAEFNFHRDVLKAGEMPDELTKRQVRSNALMSGGVGGGLIGGLLGAAMGATVGAVAASNNDLKGLMIKYETPDGIIGEFSVVGPSNVISEIISSIPRERRFKITEEGLNLNWEEIESNE